MTLEQISGTAPCSVARSPNGTPLYENACPGCGKTRLSDRRRLGNLCVACSGRRRATHGLCGHPLFKLLNNIRARCECRSATGYKHYGGRGIAVCEEWRTNPAAFVAWAESNGYQPGLEVDRRDNDGPYAPWNCQFLPHVRNSQKRRSAQCDEPRAIAVKQAMARGLSIKSAAAAAGVRYMVAWHIAKGNTWRTT